MTYSEAFGKLNTLWCEIENFCDMIERDVTFLNEYQNAEHKPRALCPPEQIIQNYTEAITELCEFWENEKNRQEEEG